MDKMMLKQVSWSALNGKSSRHREERWKRDAAIQFKKQKAGLYVSACVFRLEPFGLKMRERRAGIAPG